MRRLIVSHPEAAAAAWFFTLSLLVCGPLLGSGSLVLLDFPSGPAFPSVVALPLPSAGDPGNTFPLTAVHAALRSLDPLVADKAFLLTPVALGGFGMFRLLRRRFHASAVAAIYGGTLFGVNPFVYDRFLAGHLYLLVAYALLPWLVAPLLAPARGRTSRGVALGIAIAVVAVGSAPLAGAMLVLGGAAVVALDVRARDAAASLVAAVAVAAALSAFWLSPSLANAVGFRVGAAQLETYASRPQGVASIPSLLSLRGFWRDEFPSAVPHAALAPLALVILGLVVAGVAAGGHRRSRVAIAAAGAFGVAAAASTAFEPTERIVLWVIENLRAFGAYREPQKLIALTVFAYAVLGAVGIDTLARWFRRSAAAVAAGATLVVLAYAAGIFWAFGGRVALVHYPEGWQEAKALVANDRQDGRLLVLPWRLYAVWSFTDGRITANPAPSFFERVLVADLPEQSVDPFAAYVRQLVASRHADDLGARLAPLGVRYVLLLREADWRRYGFVRAAPELVLVYEDRGLALFENRSWRGDVQPLASVAVRRTRVGLQRAHALPLPTPSRQAVRPVRAPFIGVAERCTDGLRLHDEPARCHLGAVAAFRSPPRESELRAPADANRLAGYAISLSAVLALALARIRRPAGAR